MPAVRIDANLAPITHAGGLKMKVRRRDAARAARCTDDVARAYGIADGDVNPVEMTIAGTEGIGATWACFDDHDLCTGSGSAAAGDRLLFRPDDSSIRYREQRSSGRHWPVNTGVPFDPVDAFAAGIQQMVVAILDEDRQIVIKRAPDSILTRKGATKDLESRLSGRGDGSARSRRCNERWGAGDTEDGDNCGTG